MSEIHSFASVLTVGNSWGNRPERVAQGEQPVGRERADTQALTQDNDPRREEGRRLNVPLKELKPVEHYRAEDPEALAKAIERIEQFTRQVGRDLAFRVDQDSGKTVVTVYVQGTEDVVRQIPPEEVLAIAARMREVQGILFNGEA